MADNYRIWKLGNLDHKMIPTEESVIKLKEILKSTDGQSMADIIWGPDIELIETQGCCNSKDYVLPVIEWTNQKNREGNNEWIGVINNGERDFPPVSDFKIYTRLSANSVVYTLKVPSQFAWLQYVETFGCFASAQKYAEKLFEKFYVLYHEIKKL